MPAPAVPSGSSTRPSALAAAVASICFGASVVATRFVVGQTTPITLAFFRYLIATMCLSPVVYRVITSSMPQRDRWRIGALGMLFFGVFPWSFSAALTYSPSSRVAILMATMPLVTALVSRLRGYERLSISMVVGQLLAFGGLLLALQPAMPSPAPMATRWIGDLLTIITMLSGVTYNIFSRPLLHRYPAMDVTALSMLAGLLLLTPIAAANGALTSFPRFSLGGWGAVLFLGTFGGAMAFSLWIWALERSTPSRVAVFIALNPITAVTLSALLLNESISGQFLLGGVAVISGILIASRKTTPAAE